jgi:NADH-quinone oxidoreductase subunit F
MLISDLLYDVAGGIRGDRELKAVVPGGSSVPILRADMIEGVTMDSASLQEAGSLIGTAGMLVLEEGTDMVAFLRRVAHFYRHESCGQCTPCREGTGWMAKILRRIENGNGRMRDLDLLLEVAENMEGGRTICALADGAAWPVRNTIQRFRDEFEARCTTSSVTVEEEVAA